MAAIDTLPTDIIHLIVESFVKPRHQSFAQWKTALPILAVSPSWRRIGIEYVYSKAYIANPRAGGLGDRDDGATGSISKHGKFTAISNISLIERVRQLRRVKELIVAVDADDFGGIFHTFKLFTTAKREGLGGDNTQQIELFSHAQPGSMLAGIHTKLVANMPAALVFARWIPNVNRIDMAVDILPKSCTEFFNALLYAYMPQLSYLSYFGESNFSAPIASSALKEIDINLLVHPEKPIPVIDAHNLCKLTTVIHDNGMKSTIFRPIEDSGLISFEFLEVLDIDMFCSASMLAKFCRDFAQAQLPRLHTMRITGLHQKMVDIALARKKSLRVLRLDGYITCMIDLCRYGLGSVQKLVFEPQHFWSKSLRGEGIAHTNELFSLTGDVPEVHAWLNDHQTRLYDLELNWQYLTHLHVFDAFSLIQLMRFTLKTPNLVFLETQPITLSFVSEDDKIIQAELASRRQDFASSKLETLVVYYRFAISGSTRTALSELARIFPKLHTFTLVD